MQKSDKTPPQNPAPTPAGSAGTGSHIDVDTAAGDDGKAKTLADAVASASAKTLADANARTLAGAAAVAKARMLADAAKAKGPGDPATVMTIRTPDDVGGKKKTLASAIKKMFAGVITGKVKTGAAKDMSKDSKPAVPALLQSDAGMPKANKPADAPVSGNVTANTATANTTVSASAIKTAADAPVSGNVTANTAAANTTASTSVIKTAADAPVSGNVATKTFTTGMGASASAAKTSPAGAAGKTPVLVDAVMSKAKASADASAGASVIKTSVGAPPGSGGKQPMLPLPSNASFIPVSEPPLPRSSLVVWVVAAALLCLILWAAFFELDEVSNGTGKVIPSSHEQMIQSLEGGILVDLKVKEGDIVDKGQVLAQLDRTRTESTVAESASRVRAAMAMAARLTAEVNGTPLTFPPEVNDDPDLVRTETALYKQRRQSLANMLSGIAEALALVRRELALTEPLVARGAASDVEVLRLKRQVNELETRASDQRNQYYVKAREDLAKANAEIEAQQAITHGRTDALTRLTFTSPVRGVVKDIAVTTTGGVVPPNGKLMEIVPMEEQLLVEARISPRDVAFIHPGQEATVKITAYDYSIYGGLKGTVKMVSPDTIQDDVKRDVYYYRVYIRTDADQLHNKAGKSFPIVPGMIATVDIHTGRKTVLDYLVKPLNKAREALRER